IESRSAVLMGRGSSGLSSPRAIRTRHQPSGGLARAVRRTRHLPSGVFAQEHTAQDVDVGVLLRLHAVVAEVGDAAEAAGAVLLGDLEGAGTHHVQVGPELGLVLCCFGLARSIVGTQRRTLRKTMTSSVSYRMSAGSRRATISQNTQYRAMGCLSSCARLRPI